VITSAEVVDGGRGTEKERIVAAAVEPGAVALAVAREAIHANQLYRWRQELCRPACAAPGLRRTPAKEINQSAEPAPAGDRARRSA
jgi:transposase